MIKLKNRRYQEQKLRNPRVLYFIQKAGKFIRQNGWGGEERVCGIDKSRARKSERPPRKSVTTEERTGGGPTL